MVASDAAPDSAELGSPDLGLGPVDEANALAKVEPGVLLVLDVLDLDERGVLMLVAKPPLETHHHALHVQPVHEKEATSKQIAERKMDNTPCVDFRLATRGGNTQVYNTDGASARGRKK